MNELKKEYPQLNSYVYIITNKGFLILKSK